MNLKVKSKELDFLDEKIAEYRSELERVERELKTTQTELKLNGAAILLCRDTIEKISRNRSAIEATLTDLVKCVFGPAYSFRLKEILKNGEVKGLQPTVVKGELELENISEDCGAGAFAVLDFGFRLLAIVTHGGTGKIVIADEPLPEVDVVRWEKFGEWLADFCERMDFQIIMTTHAENQFGKTYRVVIEEGVSKVYNDD